MNISRPLSTVPGTGDPGTGDSGTGDPGTGNPGTGNPGTYDPQALFDQDGPINPMSVNEAVRTVMRAMPLIDRNEPRGWVKRRMYAAMRALAALHPRDEIELMIGVQALCAYQAASALWRAGMNLRYPAGDSTRHVTTAATAARTFDTMLKALERRQAKPLAVPPGRPAPHPWPRQDATAAIAAMEARYREGQDDQQPDEDARQWSAGPPRRSAWPTH